MKDLTKQKQKCSYVVFMFIIYTIYGLLLHLKLCYNLHTVYYKKAMQYLKGPVHSEKEDIQVLFRDRRLKNRTCPGRAQKLHLNGMWHPDTTAPGTMASNYPSVPN